MPTEIYFLIIDKMATPKSIDFSKNSKNTHFEACITDTKKATTILIFWLLIENHQSFKMRYCMALYHKGLQSYTHWPSVVRLKKQN